MRQPGWESRLAAVIEDARARPYVLGEHDCFRLACRVIEALTGVDRWPEFKGYNTKREAVRRIAREGASFVQAGDSVFGDRIDVKHAQRGDIAAFETPGDGKWHLAVVMGRNMAVLYETGLAQAPLTAAQCAWRVG